MEVSEEKQDARPTSLWKLPRRKKIILGSLISGSFLSYTCLSLLGPFYPGEAKSRGVSLIVSGWVFATYSLIQFFTAPLFGFLINKFGSRRMYLSGVFFCATSTIAFGLLELIPLENKMSFIVGSFGIRTLVALGGTSWFCSGFAITMGTFPGHMSTVMGLQETAVGVGFMAGPAIGGALFELSGFYLPFLVTGLMFMVLLPLYYFVIEQKDAPSQSGTLLPLVKSPGVMFVYFIIVVAAILMLALAPMLELHLAQFGFGPSKVGLVFLLWAVCYSISAPLAGMIADRMTNCSPVTMVGFVLLFLSYFFMGPSPILNIHHYQTVWLNMVAVGLTGVGAAIALVPTFGRMTNCALGSGIPDTTALHCGISGLWTSAYALGDTIGPILISWLSEYHGFQWATTWISFISAATTLTLLVVWIIERLRSKKDPVTSTKDSPESPCDDTKPNSDTTTQPLMVPTGSDISESQTNEESRLTQNENNKSEDIV